MEKNYHTELTIRIDWADLDLFGHVNNVAFFRYVQAARISFCDRIGLSSLNEEGKGGFMVASSQCQFRQPLHYPGNVTVLTQANWIKNSSFQLGYRIMKDNELIAEAQDVIVVYDHRLKTKVMIPPLLRERIGTAQQDSI